jgi:hypothetical protein
MTLDLADDEAAALAAHLWHALEYDPFPFAPRLDPLKAITFSINTGTVTPREDWIKMKNHALQPYCEKLRQDTDLTF